MKIGARIYAIVGLMGLVSVAIGGMSAYTIVEYNKRMDAFENAADRAYLGERLNRYVTAVVMESRGIYAATSADETIPFGENLMRTLDGIDALLAEWRPLVDV